MKKLELKQMENVQGGGFIEGFCGGTLLVRGLASLAGAAIAPPVALAMGVTMIGCTIYMLS